MIIVYGLLCYFVGMVVGWYVTVNYDGEKTVADDKDEHEQGGIG